MKTSSLIGFVVVIVVLAACALGSKENDKRRGLQFGVLNGTCGANLTWTLSDSILTITGTGKMYDYSYDNRAPWYSNRALIKGLVVEDGVTTLGDYAFDSCSDMTSADVPDSVTLIGVYCFSGCSQLESIIFPPNITTIRDCSFSSCVSLKSVTIPEGVKTIEGQGFFNCINLVNVSLPSTLKSVGFLAFSQCKSLHSVVIPAGVKKVDYCVFCECTSLVSITVEEGNLQYVSVDGVLFDYERISLIQYPPGRNSTCYSIPDSVKIINSLAFSHSTLLVNITFPDGLKKIGDQAFKSCHNLTTAIIPQSVTAIGRFAFMSCFSLTKVIIPDAITTIEESTFMYCTSLAQITIPDNVYVISGYAFANCFSLRSVVIPEGVNIIDISAFASCNNLTSVFYQGHALFSNAVFSMCISLQDVCVPPDYQSSTFCDRSVTPDTDRCKAFRLLFNHCYKGNFSHGHFIQEKMKNATDWEMQTTPCRDFFCDNETGPKSWNMCNSSDEDLRLCMDDECIDNWEKVLEGWTVAIEYDDVKYADYNLQDVVTSIYEISGVWFGDMKIGTETGANESLLRNAVGVKDEKSASSIANALKRIKKANCEYGILCKWKSVAIFHDGKPSGASSVHGMIKGIILLLFTGVQMVLVFN